MEIGEGTAYEDEGCEHITDFGDDLSQAIELVVQRCLHTVVNLRCSKYLSVFGSVAHSGGTHDAVAVHNGGTAHGVVGGIGGF